MLTMFFLGFAVGVWFLILCSWAGRYAARHSKRGKELLAQLEEANRWLRVHRWMNMLEACKQYHDHLHNRV